jgi:hypothetical protein
MVCDAASVKYFVASHAFHVKNKKQREQELVCCHLSGQEHLLALRMHNVSATISGTFVVLGPIDALLDDSKKKRNSMSNERTNQQNQSGQQGGQQGGGQQGGQQNQTNKPGQGGQQGGQGGQRQGGQQDR